MTNISFLPADILLPDGVDMEKWSVVACDQFSSEPIYWDRVEKMIGESPSTLKFIVPEARLEIIDPEQSAAAAGGEMEKYIKDGLFRTIEHAFIYVERTVSDGSVRRGLVGMIDLEAYDYMPGSRSVVRASEKTILSRLPARIEIRKRAPLEMPHIMALINDKERRVIETLAEETAELEPVYNFELMENGGRVKGWRVTGSVCAGVTDRLAALFEGCPVQIIIGDGNHSLAAAKDYWDKLKPSLGKQEQDGHPARYALVELGNVYDSAIVFEAIHRLVSGIDPAKLVNALASHLSGGAGYDYTLGWVSTGGTGRLTARAFSIGEMIDKLQTFLDAYVGKSGGIIDYIHGEQSLNELSKTEGHLGLLLPPMDKSDFFNTVIDSGVFPKKSFSIGSAQDKRYYLECRAIR